MNNIPFNSDEVCTRVLCWQVIFQTYMEKQHEFLYFDELWLSQEEDGKLQYRHNSQDI